MNEKYHEAFMIVKSRLKSLTENETDFTVILYSEIEPLFHKDITNEIESHGYVVYVVREVLSIGDTGIRYTQGDMLISHEQQVIDALKKIEG